VLEELFGEPMKIGPLALQTLAHRLFFCGLQLRFTQLYALVTRGSLSRARSRASAALTALRRAEGMRAPGRGAAGAELAGFGPVACQPSEAAMSHPCRAYLPPCDFSCCVQPVAEP